MSYCNSCKVNGINSLDKHESKTEDLDATCNNKKTRGRRISLLKNNNLKIEQLFYIWNPLQMLKFIILEKKVFKDFRFWIFCAGKYAQTCKCYNCFSYRVCGERQSCQICIFTLHINNYTSKLSVSCYLYSFREAYLHHLGLSHLHHVSPWSWGILHALSWLPGENWKRTFTCILLLLRYLFSFVH